MLRLLASVLLLGTTSALPAGAHQIESALTYLEGNLELSSSFSNGEPTQGAVAVSYTHLTLPTSYAV